MENGVGDNDPVSELFDQFCSASTCKSIVSTFQQLCNHIGLGHADHRNFYRKIRARINTWKAHALWVKLDKRATHKEYQRGHACANTNVIVIGGGLCGLRVAIECALLGARTVVVEKRDRFSRNNVLHLWPFVITDLRNLGAKKFFGKFCAGSIDHISIRQLQCILLKVALLVGVEIHLNVNFIDIIEPTTSGTGWRIKVEPENHSVSEYEFDVLIGADGKRNTLEGFKRKEFRGKLAIAITANFINRNTLEEVCVEEISGVAFIFNQKFFKDLNEATGIDLENIVYYKDDTHYFVMTAKKLSLLDKGVLKQDYADTFLLLHRDNVDQEALASYAIEAADFSTNHRLPHLDFAVNHYGQADMAMFDFTSLFQAENASRVVERMGHKLLITLVGDSLLEPFWPTGSGCARGFLGAFDTAWMIKNWSCGRMTTLQVLAARESIYQQLSQTTPENGHKNHNQYTIDPATRYIIARSKWLKLEKVVHLYDTGDNSIHDDIVEMPAKRSKNSECVDTYSLLRWCQKLLNTGRYPAINIADLTTSWHNGLAFCALVHTFKPDAINYECLNADDVLQNSQLAFDSAQREFGISPVMTGEDLATCDTPDKLTVVSYLSQFYDHFKKQRPPSDDLNTSYDENRKHRSPSHKLSILQKIRSRASISKLRKSKPDITKSSDGGHIGGYTCPSKRDKQENSVIAKTKEMLAYREQERRDLANGNIELTQYSKLPIDEIATKLTVGKELSPENKNFNSKLQMEEISSKFSTRVENRLGDYKNRQLHLQEEMTSAVKVSDMAEILVQKFKSNADQSPLQDKGKKVKGQPMMVAAQPASEFCFFCKKRVYIMERMTVENVFFHSLCFKCDFCSTVLKATTYTVDKTSYGDAMRFFCFRHSTPLSRFGRPPGRKRVADQLEENANIPVDTRDNAGPTPNKFSTPNKSPKKAPVFLSPIVDGDDFNLSVKTPERIEFENTIEGLPLETEEEQWEHNLRASFSADSILGDDVDDDSDSDLESDPDEFQEAVDLYNSGRLEESISLARESLQRSQENVMDLVHDALTNGDADEDTEVADSEYESEDSETEMEDETTDPTEPSSYRTAPLFAAPQPQSSTPVEKPAPKPTIERLSLEAVSKARVNFFNSPAEPVRLDPFKMFGMVRKSETPKEEVRELVAGGTADGGGVLPGTGVGEMETDEDTDSQVPSRVLDPGPAHQDNTIVEKASMTDDDKANIPASVDNTDLLADVEADDEEMLEKTALSHAMQKLLEDMERRSDSGSDTNDVVRENSDIDDDRDDDEVFVQYKRALSVNSSHKGSTAGSQSSSDRGRDRPHSSQSKSSGDIDDGVNKTKLIADERERQTAKSGNVSDKSLTASSEFGATERSVLRSVQQMSDKLSNSLEKGDSTLEVLRSIADTNLPSVGDNEHIERCIQYLDDRFVTVTRGSDPATRHKSQKSSVHRSSSSDSFNLSTPSHSTHTSSSSLSDMVEANRQFINTQSGEELDDQPDPDLLADYRLTLSHALGEDSDELSPRQELSPRDPSPVKELSPREPSPMQELSPCDGELEEDLDRTLHAGDAVSPESPESEYLSPLSDRSDASEYVTPQSARNSSVYETPNSSVIDKSTQNASKDSPMDVITSANVSTSSALKRFSLSEKKKKSSIGKPPKVIRQESWEDKTEIVPHSSKTIIRPRRHGSREGSLEANPLEKDAWGSCSSSCSSVNDTPQKHWRPLPPVPIESSSSPKQSKTFQASRKLPDVKSVKSNAPNKPVTFHSNFMKKLLHDSGSADSHEKSGTSAIKPQPSEMAKNAQIDTTSEPKPLPPKPSTGNDSLTSSGKAKIPVDFSKIDHSSGNNSDSGADGKKRRISVDQSIRKAMKSRQLHHGKDRSDEDMEDIPFADDSEDALEEKFFTPATSMKPKKLLRTRDENGHRDIRKRILPTPPKPEPAVLSPEQIREIREAEIGKAREEARQRARLKSDEELGIKDTGYTPSGARPKRILCHEFSNETTTSHSNTPSVGDVISDSDDNKASLQKITVSFKPDTPLLDETPKRNKVKKKKKKTKSRDASLSTSSDYLDDEVKKEKKKRSLLASILSGVKTPTDKSKGLKEKDRSSSADTLDEKTVKKKKSKTPKSEKRKDKRKRKSGAGNDESALSDGLKDLKIGSMFSNGPQKRVGLQGKIMPPKASVDDFTDSEDELSMSQSMTSLSDAHSRRVKSDHGPMSEEELNARITRRIQHVARKQQKQEEQKRLWHAQEIQRKIQEADVRQRQLEERGVIVERALRGEGPEAERLEADLMQDWFNLVHEKNTLVRLESELMVNARELELEDRQGRLQQQLRESMALDDSDTSDDVFEKPQSLFSKIKEHWRAGFKTDGLKSPEEQTQEQKIYSELIDVVDERDKLVAMMEEERIREREEDKDLETVMRAKGYSLSPVSSGNVLGSKQKPLKS